MDVFQLREQLIQDYSAYASSFIQIRDTRIEEAVHNSLEAEVFWPDPLIQLNPMFKEGSTIDELVETQTLHPECSRIFRKNKTSGIGQILHLHRHQQEAIEIAHDGHNYILTTGTGSGKSLAYIVPIVDHVLRRGSGRGIQAIIVYPMNALANSQEGELRKFLFDGYPEGQPPVTFARYTGQENDDERQHVIDNPPDILLTNYVMLELIMTRPRERRLIERARGLRFLVLDELHTYRGRQGADVALLMRRVRDRLETSEQKLIFVGTSATLSSEGSFDQQREQIAQVGTQMFGSVVEPEHVIGETLRRTTQPYPNADAFLFALTEAVRHGASLTPPTDYRSFVTHPLSIWIEDTFGLRAADGRLTRQEPRSLQGDNGAAQEMSHLTGADQEACAAVIQRWLLAGYQCQPDLDTGFSPFAFRLHQFISPGDTVYATVEPEATRHITLNGQHFVPGDRERVLFPLCFCRECGQEYYTVRITTGEGRRKVMPREFRDYAADDESDAGYLYLNTENPWPHDLQELIEGGYLPDDWIEERNGVRRVRSHRRSKLPQHIRVLSDGDEDGEGQECVYISSPFMFCLNCGVSYAARQSEFGKLATLSSEGRSSATTLLSLSAIRSLKTSDLDRHAQKLLSFTDNRQDASLQAGHFNDFIEVSLLRGAIYRAAERAGTAGLRHEVIAEKVFEALNLPLDLYASDPTVRFQALQETQRALRQVLGYRIYRDLRRGWRIALPNLEQCGLLRIDYLSLDEVCAAEDVWEQCHPLLATASPETRIKVARVLLDYMRRELAIKVDYLEQGYQDRIRQLSSQRLVDPWSIDEDERLDYASVLFPRSRGDDDTQGHTYVSARGGFGIYLRRSGIFPEYDAQSFGAIGLDETETVIRQLLEGLRAAGLVEIIVGPHDETDVPGYQLLASAMRWRAGDGTRTFHDPIRVPNEPEAGGRPNPFFVRFYRDVAGTLAGLEAHEHTAQVPYDEREKRERRFRTGDLPILYCSPTMELGVDIAELNVVNLRNVPPTPANYAQRSGRAGRSGQPALVFTYCSAGSPHDQYFFKRPERIVAGSVAPPRLDLTNEDLLRAHLRAIWLAETGIDLHDTLKEILDMSDDPPPLNLLPEIIEQAESSSARQAARQRGQRVLATIAGLSGASLLLDMTMQNVVRAFDDACTRWRNLYWSALKQVKSQEIIRRDPSRSPFDKNQAERLRREALAMIDLLTEIDNLAQSDFYSYRYFATEGFLPGYSFPRLPISALIPARRGQQRDEFLSRPRFLALSEFGPRAVIYHEGSRYLINQVIMPVTAAEDDGPQTTQIKQCGYCGYVHPVNAQRDYDLCESCGMPLDPPLHALLRMENVVTKRRDRINADEEERLRLGYEIRTGVRFAERGGRPEARIAEVRTGEEVIARLTYAPSATLWRINLGWARRRNKHQYGFVLDIERGYWARNEQLEDDVTDPLSERTRRVIPYVEDSRNCLLFEPPTALQLEEAASLQAALKRAIEAVFQLEDNELAAEPLPDADSRRILLFYEAAEGGAGVLRQLVDDPKSLARVAREALGICHFDPETGEDLRRAPRAHEDCEAACYDCLLSYSNQREHPILDRQIIREFLGTLATSEVLSSPVPTTRQTYLETLLSQCESDLERDWLLYLHEHGYRLPTRAQAYVETCQTRPDFVYEGDGVYVAIYVDGAPHDYPHRQARDQQQRDCMEDYGYRVIRFDYHDDWETTLRAHPYVFGGEP